VKLQQFAKQSGLRLIMTSSKRRPRGHRKATGESNSPPSGQVEAKDQAAGPKHSWLRLCLRRARWLAWNGLAFFGAIIGIWVAIWPHVYVYPSVDLDPNNPMFTTFVVRNEGYVKIRDVRFSCSVKYLTRPGGPLVVGLGDYTNRFSDPRQVSRVIAPGEEASELLPLSGMQHNQWDNADVAVRLEFRPWRWVPYRWEEKRRFEIRRKGDQWHWCPQPIHK
jgi:hypothetical protein